MGTAAGFSFREHSDGHVVITHRGRHAATPRAGRAALFLEEVAAGEPHLVMVRWTGNDKRGNERTARPHPRNR